MLRIIDRYFKRIFKWNFKTLSQYFVVNTYIQFLLRKKPFNYYFRHLIILWSTHFYDRDFYTDWISPRSATIIYFSVSPRGRGWPWWRLLESCWDGGGWELFVSLHPRYCWHANRSVARTHSHILHCIGVYSISLYDMYIYIYMCMNMCICARLSPFWGRLLWKLAARYIHIHPGILTVIHM